MDILQTVYKIIREEISRWVPTWTWMTVTSTNPLRIKYDHEDEELDLEPDSAIGEVLVGDRVFVKMRSGETPVIVGRAGGAYLEEYAKLGTNSGENIDPLPVIVLGPSDTEEPSIRLQRIYNGDVIESFFYCTERGSLPVAAFITRVNSTSYARFTLNTEGQAAVNTYDASPSTTATRPLPFAMASGVISTGSIPSGGAVSSYVVTFPSGRFTSTPLTFVSFRASTPRLTVAYGTNGTTGITIFVNNWSTGTQSPVAVQWLSVQLEA